MKKLTLFILLFLSISIIAKEKTQIIPITDDLNAYLDQRSDDDLVRINIRLKAQYDTKSIKTQLASLDRIQRRELIKNELKAFSQTAQADVVNYLESKSYFNEAEIIHRFWIANVITCMASESVIYELAMRTDVARIDIDEERNLLMNEPSSAPDQIKGTDEIAYNVSQVNAPDVWALGFTGEGVIVSVIDTGVNYNHDDLVNQMWDDPSFPNHGWDFYNNDNDPMDDHSHGTHCAGTVAGDGSAGSQTGMAPDAQIMALKVLSNSGNGLESNVWEAIEFTVDHGGDIISMSLGWPHSSNPDRATWRTTLDNALAAGVIAAIAAGNEDGNINDPDDVRTPGDCPPPWLHPDQTLQGGISAVVCVGATDSNDNIASFSSRGPSEWESIDPYFDYPFNPEMGLIRPDVSAPGVNVKSCDYSNTSGYSFKSGTSMATPGTAGVMALLLSKNINLTPEEITIALETTAIDLGTPGKDNVFGSGRIDAFEAINNTNYPGPLYSSHTISEDNSNGEIESGESVLLSIEMFNGSEDSFSDVDVMISSPSSYISITDNIESYGNFAPGEYISISDGFGFDVVEGTPGNKVINIDVEATDGVESWTSTFNLLTYGPDLEFGNLSIDDAAQGNGNGRLDPGETADLVLEVHNNGQANSSNVVVDLGIVSDLVTVVTGQQTIPQILSEDFETASFTVTVDDEAPIGSYVSCDFDLLSGVFTNSLSLTLKIGLIIEDWESNSFNQFNWTFDDDADWVISNENPYEGEFCSQSGNITHNQSTSLILSYTVGADDSISFYKEVSSEATYDFLFFYIDNVKKGEWSGEVAWSRSVYAVSAGTHTFKWEYYKDVFVSDGDDRARIDFISLPPGLMPTVFAGDDASICFNETYSPAATAENYNSLEWTTSGDGIFDNETILNPVYTPGTFDIENESVTLTLTAFGDNGNTSSDLLLEIELIPEIPITPEGEVLLCVNSGESVYNSTPTEGYTYEWEIIPASAGSTSSDSASAIISWNETYTGDVEIQVKSINECGESEFSDPLIVTILGAPDAPEMPLGENTLCINPEESTYETEANTEYSYTWDINPPEAGTTESDSAIAVIYWSQDFTGEVQIRVMAISECGESEFSEPNTVTIYNNPEVNLGEDTEVCIGNYIVLDAGNEGATYLWSTGETTQVIDVDTTGMDENNNRVISVLVTDINGCSSEDEIMISFFDCTGIHDYNGLTDLEIFPNPNNGTFTIQLSAAEPQESNIELINMQGKVVYKDRIMLMKGLNSEKIQMDQLSNEVYYLRVVSEKGIVTKKMIVRK